MKVLERMKAEKNNQEGPRKFVKEFTVSSLVSFGVVAALGIIWVFILGVLVGRGYKPENAVPQVAQYMPSSQPQAQQADNKESPQVLKPEELGFMDSLQGRKPPETVTVDSTKKPQDGATPATAVASTAPAPAAQAAAPAAPAATPVSSTLEKTPAPLPKGKVATAPAQPDKKTAQAPAPKDEKHAAAPKDDKQAKKDGTGKMRCIYQLAALEKKDQAQEEADRYSKKGLKATVQEGKSGGKTVWRVVTTLQGSESEIKSSLEKGGAKKPILREKKNL